MYKELLSICNKYGYKTTKNLSGITLEKVLKVLADRGNIVECIRNDTGCAKQTVTNFLKKTFPDRDPIHDSNIAKWLLAKEGRKYCPRCEEVKGKEHFYGNVTEKDGLQDFCKDCSTSYRKESYSKDPGKEIAKNTARRQNTTSNKTPKWADLDKIEEFYRNRPEGHHVDHIIPLNGKLVTGLHVLENLQYLSAEDNLKKGNRYTP